MSRPRAPLATLSTYTVQAAIPGRAEPLPMGEFTAQTNVGAIIQAGHVLARVKQNATQITATLKV